MTTRVITKTPDLLAQIPEKFYTSPVKMTKGTNGVSWFMPVKELLFGYDWYLEKYELIGHAPVGSVVVDAGCKSGYWMEGSNPVLRKGVIRVGADPIDYNSMQWSVDHYFKCALDDVSGPTTMTFNLFDEPGCNSLLPKSDHLSMRNVVKTITVPVRTLESVLLEKVSSGTTIHYVKCDCQGKDVDVIKSLRSFLPFTKYVQIESSFDHSKPFYVNQPSYEDDIIAMDKLGFEPIFWMEYPSSPLPEGEILFKNKNI
jgi:FkbM family methyltransferase